MPQQKASQKAGIIQGMVNGWIDTHNHLDAAEFDEDRLAVVHRAQLAGVATLVMPAVSAQHFERVPRLAHEHGVAYALGIHPMAVPQAHDDDLLRLEDALSKRRDDPRLVAVGEIGLDAFDAACLAPAMMAKQQRFYAAQLTLARANGLPVILHVRRTVDLVLAGLRRHPVAGGIAHAYNGSLAQADVFRRMGFKLGFGGAITYTRALHLRRLATHLPLSMIVLETDAPDMPPHWLYQTRAARDADPHPLGAGRTQARNEAAQLPRIAADLAALRGLSLETLAAESRFNACAALPRLAAWCLRPWPTPSSEP